MGGGGCTSYLYYPYFPSLPALGKHSSTVSLYGYTCSEHFIEMELQYVTFCGRPLPPLYFPL